MSWKLNVSEINESCSEVIDNLQEESLAVYCYICEQWEGSSGSAINNKLFQFVFRSFYRLDNAGLTDEFKGRFFELLEDSRGINPNIKDVCKDLYEIRNRKGSKSLQFSFATKLANTINASLPIYDSEVAKMYDYKPPAPNKSFDDRISLLLKFYEFLVGDYSRIINEGVLKRTFDAFDNRFPDYSHRINQNKKLDFIVWSAGKLKGK
jgi:uncharacterized protein YutD